MVKEPETYNHLLWTSALEQGRGPASDVRRRIVAASPAPLGHVPLERPAPVQSRHAKRVGTLSQELALAVNRPIREVLQIRWGALLHDIGKIGVPTSLLEKAGPLSSDERRLIQDHVHVGALLVSRSGLAGIRIASEIALHHHEWWNGTGYPAGLKGAAIPLCARIVAIADVFDALTHQRPYKNAWSAAAALVEIVRLAGQQFDPLLVAAFLTLEVVHPIQPYHRPPRHLRVQ